MNKLHLSRFIFILISTTLHQAQADVVPAVLFQDNAVLQHGKLLPIWGTADPGEKITVSFQQQSESTTTSQDGTWQIQLQPLTISKQGSALTIQGSNSITLNNIVVGEVWLASGQSNMEWSVDRCQDLDLEPILANWPNLRQINFNRTVRTEPSNQIDHSGWQSANQNNLGKFSAVAYHFAKDLHLALDRPIGIINATWGGTRIEPWIPSSALAQDSSPFTEVKQRWDKVEQAYPAARDQYREQLIAWEKRQLAAKQSNTPFNERKPQAPRSPLHNTRPAGLFNGMIHPACPAAIAGVIWYQGESNAGQANEYSLLFKTLITSWREQFKQANLPFYWVQLANFKERPNTDWPALREAQDHALQLPHTGQVVTLDVGDVNDIHPRNKQSVGRRLARLALNRQYQIPLADSGPRFKSFSKEGQNLRIEFDHTERGLKFTSKNLTGFEIAGKDQKFFPATAKIDKNSVILSSPKVPSPVAARYAWQAAPEASLLNGLDLPAAPFRTHPW